VESLAADQVDGDYLIMITKQGVIKRTLLSEFSYQRKGGKIAINLDEGDELIFAAHTHGDSDIMIATSTGLAARFPEEKVSPMGRTARGVRGVRLMGDDYVAGAVIIERDEEWRKSHRLIMITENGFGKRLDEAHFENKGRGIKGMCCYKITDRTGPLVGIETVSETDDVMMITNEGMIIRTPCAGIPEYGRTAAGVIVMRLAEDAKIVNFTVTAAAEEETEAEAEAEAEE
jgi:DNA gyrase subunit A